MAKSRARKKRPASLRRERTAGEPPPTDGDQATNLRRFTLSSWAVVAQLLRARRDQTAILDLLGFLDWLGDSNLNRILRQLPPLPCRAGCAYCCYVGPDRPDLLPAELLRIVDYLRREGSEATLADLEARLRDPNSGAQAEKRPCLFLSGERCLIYPVRPMRCRAQHSHDRAACKGHYLGQSATMPLLRDPAMLYKSLQIGMRLGLREAGLQDRRLALDGALRVALFEQPNALEQWIETQPTFDAVALPEEANEGELLAQLMGQAKGEARAEARRLSRIVTSLLEQPGAWARYPTTGEVPPT